MWDTVLKRFASGYAADIGEREDAPSPDEDRTDVRNTEYPPEFLHCRFREGGLTCLKETDFVLSPE
ncbi:hypothetical protein SP90_07170 [Halodesulfovibrio spirochaetisodalis]|uniref:Uncharacterized protein n=1 Tax=Halodesulfovibrio spirochaetisodalis TaxID=1560234 RepID=A0A1B7XEW9_9BACT|nr:hypothetical protein SP90_07170 [Halodesulfovibrio spirochaetisodalis]